MRERKLEIVLAQGLIMFGQKYHQSIVWNLISEFWMLQNIAAKFTADFEIPLEELTAVHNCLALLIKSVL